MAGERERGAAVVSKEADFGGLVRDGGTVEGYAYLAAQRFFPDIRNSAYIGVFGKNGKGNRFQIDCRFDYDAGKEEVSVVGAIFARDNVGSRRAEPLKRFRAVLRTSELPEEIAHTPKNTDPTIPLSQDTARWILEHIDGWAALSVTQNRL
jgi:hypothetical protein